VTFENLDRGKRERLRDQHAVARPRCRPVREVVVGALADLLHRPIRQGQNPLPKLVLAVAPQVERER
jgi:hypothetical protein